MSSELLVRIVDRTHPDPALNAIVSKRGDVIAVHPAGSAWGTQEYANPEWRLVRVDGLSEDEAIGMLTPESPPLHNPQAKCRMRIMRLDLDPLGVHTWPADGIATIALQTFRDVRKTKPLVNP